MALDLSGIPPHLIQALLARIAQQSRGGGAGMPMMGGPPDASLGMKREAALPDLQMPGYRGEANGSEGLGLDLGGGGGGGGGMMGGGEAGGMMGMMGGGMMGPPPGPPAGGGAFLSPDQKFVDREGFEVYDGDEEGPPPALRAAAKRRAGLRGKMAKKGPEKKPSRRPPASGGGGHSHGM